MLHHISISVQNPPHVANVLAKMMKGKAFPFPVFPDSYIVIVDDNYGSAIEILPLGLELVPGEKEVTHHLNSSPSPFSASHIAISVPISQEEIETIAKEEGWLHRYCDRSPFDLIEVWVENHLLLELIPPEMSSHYLDFMNAENYQNCIKEMELQPH